MDYSLFEKIIMKRACCFFIICSIVLIVSLFAIRYIFLKMQDNKPLFYTLLSLCTIAIVGAGILGSSVVYSSIYDIKNQAYVIYSGVFSIERDVETVSGTCTLILYDKEKTKLETNAYILDSGKYTGKVIYGEKTKIVLDLNTGDG